MPYPTYLDFNAFLESRGLSCSELTKTDKQAAITAAVRRWEMDTGWQPFLANSADETRTLDGPEGRIIFPNFGIVSLTSLTIDGNAFAVNDRYWLQNQIPNGGPYTTIEVDSYLTGVRRAIVMVGKFGYTLTLPAEVKSAILSYAAWMLYPQITGLDGDVKREKQGPVEFEYQQAGDGMHQGKRGAFMSAYEAALQIYRWVRL